MRCLIASSHKVLAENTRVADQFWSRFKGLLGTQELKTGEALLLVPCNSIHTFGMAFPIDALFLDHENKIIYMLEVLAPWKMSKIVWKAKKVLELPAHTIQNTSLQLGEELLFV